MKIKKRKQSWADRRFQNGASYTRNSVGVKRVPVAQALAEAEPDMARIRQKMIDNCPPEMSNDKFNPKTGLFETKGRKDGRCNRTACQRRIGNHPELPEPRPQYVMEHPYSSHPLFYCRRCHEDFVAWDRKIGQADRTRLFEVE